VSDSIHTAVLVDATGTDRKVMGLKKGKDSKVMSVTGIEFHIKVDSNIYQHFNNSLSFFLGQKWMPQGYGWIFPMGDQKLKVGVVRYFPNEHFVPYEPSYQHYLDQLLSLCGKYELEDRHGKTIHYSLGQRDIRSAGPLIAIGDAISCINPLGWEGIRHALVSGRCAAQSIIPYLKKENSDLRPYDKRMSRYFGWRWTFSEMMMRSLFTTKNDRSMDSTIHHFSLMNNDEIIDVIFNYKFHRTFKSYYWYYVSRLKNFFSNTK